MAGVLMSNRVVKRVPLDFDAPLGEVWSGYIMPEEMWPDACPTCGPDARGSYGRDPRGRPYGDGLTVEARAVEESFYAFGAPDALRWSDKLGQAEVDNLVAEGRLQELREVPEEERCGQPCDDAPEGAVWRGEPCGRFRGHEGEHHPRPSEWVTVPRTAAEVNAANRSPGLFGHDGINRWILVKFRCRVLGIETSCGTCGGHGSVASDEARRAYEEWEGTEPPTGVAWQMWETTTEGSPISPPFASASDLAVWCAANLGRPGMSSDSMSYEDWMRVIDGTALGVDVATGEIV